MTRLNRSLKVAPFFSPMLRKGWVMEIARALENRSLQDAMSGVALACCAFFLLLSPALAEQKSDPLTPLEVDQLRDTAMEPDLRLKLYVAFARARLDGTR